MRSSYIKPVSIFRTSVVQMNFFIWFVFNAVAHELDKRDVRVGTSRCDLRVVGGESASDKNMFNRSVPDNLKYLGSRLRQISAFETRMHKTGTAKNVVDSVKRSDICQITRTLTIQKKGPYFTNFTIFGFKSRLRESVRW